ncbi:MAG TPA: IclR family transcriptional regulator C-terminal domain-containing protein [Ramlibacter sp.]|nr:IclR family transcriptional regulator C-terminal domain-containing protein [Ramlibacter sp.]
MTRASSSGDGTGSLEKALDVLEAVGAAPQGLSQGEITERLALPRTTVYRLLATLVTRGLLRRDPLRKVYCLGFRCFEMARQAYAAPDLVAASASELRALRDLTGETSYLATLDGLEVISLERYDGAHSQRSASALGERKPVHCTSQGKAILSAMAADARDAIVRDLTLKALTPHTITDRRRLQAELKITAARGWSIDDEEIVMGVRCVGAPVVDAQGKVRGAISVAGPAWRITRERAELLGPEVAEAARRIGAQLPSGSPLIGDPAVQAVEGPWAFHGAFPRWRPDTQRLYWADMLAPALRVFDGSQDRALIEVDSPVTGLAFRGDDLVLAHEGGVLRVTPDGLSAPLSAWPAGQLLALCAGPRDTLWAAMATTSAGCAVGEVQAGGGFAAHWTVDEPVHALCWDMAGEQLHATAPGSGSLLLMRPGSSAVRRLASLPKGSGRLGGLAVDEQGGVWTALRDGWSVVRIAHDGNLDRVVGLPVPHPSDVALAGRQLFITTARQPVALDVLANAPLSGRLLVVQI